MTPAIDSTDAERARLTGRIVEGVRAGCAARWGSTLRAVILTGSMARNEGTFRQAGGGWKVAGDAEFVLVFSPAGRLPCRDELAGLGRSIEDILSRDGLDCPLDLSAVKPRYFTSLRPHMYAYELRHCGQTVWGDGGAVESIPEFAAEEIPREDALRTLCNRIVEQVGALALYGLADAAPPEPVRHSTVKLYLDMTSSLLLFKGGYAPGYAARQEKLAELCARGGDDWPFPAGAFLRRVTQCTAWKLSTSGTEEDPGWECWRDAVAHAHQLWRWELAKLTGAPRQARDAELWAAWIRMQRWRGGRGWLYALRRRGWHRSWRLWPHWAKLAPGGSPRIWVYGLAARLLFAAPDAADGQAKHWHEACRRLPDPVSCEDWQGAGAAVLRNYREFLVGTRS